MNASDGNGWLRLCSLIASGAHVSLSTSLTVISKTVLRDSKRAADLTDYITSWICGRSPKQTALCSTHPDMGTWIHNPTMCTPVNCSYLELLAVVTLSKILRGHSKYLDRDYFPKTEECIENEGPRRISVMEYMQCQLKLIQMGMEHANSFSDMWVILNHLTPTKNLTGPLFDPTQHTALDWDELPLIYFETFFDLVNLSKYAFQLINPEDPQHEVFEMCDHVDELGLVLESMSSRSLGHLWGDLAYLCMHFGRDKFSIYGCARAEEMYSELHDLFYKITDLRFELLKVLHPKDQDLWVKVDLRFLIFRCDVGCKELSDRAKGLDQVDPLCIQALNIRELYACALVNAHKHLEVFAQNLFFTLVLTSRSFLPVKGLKEFLILFTRTLQVQNKFFDMSNADYVFNPSTPFAVYGLLQSIASNYIRAHLYREATVVCEVWSKGEFMMKSLESELPQNLSAAKKGWKCNDSHVLSFFSDLTAKWGSEFGMEKYFQERHLKERFDCDEVDYLPIEAEALSHRGHALYRLCRIQEAKDCFSLSLHISGRILAPEHGVADSFLVQVLNRVVALGTVGDLYLATGDVHLARAIYQACIPLSDVFQTDRSLNEADVESLYYEQILPTNPFEPNFMEKTSANQQKAESFLKVYRDKYLAMNSDLAKHSDVNLCGFPIGDVELRLENWERAYFYGEITCPAGEEHPRSACKGEYICGYASMMRGDYPMAFQSFKSCLKHCKKFGFLGSQVYLMVAVGQLLSQYSIEHSELREFEEHDWSLGDELPKEEDQCSRKTLALKFIARGEDLAQNTVQDANCEAFAALQAGLLSCSTQFHTCTRSAPSTGTAAVQDCESCAKGRSQLEKSLVKSKDAQDKIGELNASEALARVHLERGEGARASEYLTRFILFFVFKINPTFLDADARSSSRQ
eukprot:766745-Hanusia_phi.AAC.6